MDHVELGRRIRMLRLQKEMTQAALAEKTGVSASFIGHIERGTRIVSLETFVSLCSALEAEPNDLLVTSGAPGLSYGSLNEEKMKRVQRLLHDACQLLQSGQ